MSIYLQLFFSFFKVGILTFGGGYAMLPMLEREIIDKQHWSTQEELLNYYAIGQCTPGIIAVNTATFIGTKTKGTSGAFVATLGMITPSLIIISAIAAVLTSFSEIVLVQHALAGIRVAVVVLVVFSIVKLLKSAVKDSLGWCIFFLSFACSVVFNISPVFVILISAALGIIVNLFSRKKAD